MDQTDTPLRQGVEDPLSFHDGIAAAHSPPGQDVSRWLFFSSDGPDLASEAVIRRIQQAVDDAHKQLNPARDELKYTEATRTLHALENQTLELISSLDRVSWHTTIEDYDEIRAQLDEIAEGIKEAAKPPISRVESQIQDSTYALEEARLRGLDGAALEHDLTDKGVWSRAKALLANATGLVKGPLTHEEKRLASARESVNKFQRLTLEQLDSLIAAAERQRAKAHFRIIDILDTEARLYRWMYTWCPQTISYRSGRDKIKYLLGYNAAVAREARDVSDAVTMLHVLEAWIKFAGKSMAHAIELLHEARAEARVAPKKVESWEDAVERVEKLQELWHRQKGLLHGNHGPQLVFSFSSSSSSSSYPPSSPQCCRVPARGFLLATMTNVFALALALAGGLVLATALFTTLRFRLGVRSWASPKASSRSLTPVVVPYTWPFLGLAADFLTSEPGAFWSRLFAKYPVLRPGRKDGVGAFTLTLGPSKTLTVLTAPATVQALFRRRELHRHAFNDDIVVQGLGIDMHEARDKFWARKEGPSDAFGGLTPAKYRESLDQEYLLKGDPVNRLTAEFTATFARQLENEAGDGALEIGLYEWLRPRMFAASTRALFGQLLLDMCPTLESDFFDFDAHMLSLFYKLPKLLTRTAARARAKAADGLTRWHSEIARALAAGEVKPPADDSLEVHEVLGAKFTRMRQRYFEARGMTMRSRGALDLGFLFGLSSNAIPATGWTLMHLLHGTAGRDPTLLGRLRTELRRAATDIPGSPLVGVHVPTLTALPLLNSVFHETLRFHADAMVTRDELASDMVLPVDATPPAAGGRSVLLRKGTTVVAPTWVAHHSEETWAAPSDKADAPPASSFCPTRFLRAETDAASGTEKIVFSTAGTAGKLFPFGGGTTMCTGRLFAKQEVLAAVGIVLLNFDFDIVPCNEEASLPSLPRPKETLPGSVILAPEGDLRVRIRRRAG
ncbi:cytochrome P450 [Lineolata rhizophorae]|uniref:Cytochrome P450 n=1 Tax=Lineolata rhizophorae TaxID=578093 RepID=A0A6A6NRG2_9PEZI|nr:cytochrome P450 [Lineolata rhizophorae]